MNFTNSTRVSLVGRLSDHDDSEAWSEFVEIYGPLIYRYGRRRGIQDADAADLAQDVLQAVSQSIVRFEYDPAVGRFRSWLYLITRRVLSRRFDAQKRWPRGTGDTDVLRQLHDMPGEEVDDVWEREYRSHLFRWASDQIQSEFVEKTWSAFWKTAVDGEKPSQVAEELGAQCRVGLRGQEPRYETAPRTNCQSRRIAGIRVSLDTVEAPQFEFFTTRWTAS